MTKFGKILVFANLALSLVFATWALALFTQRVDWLDKKKDANDDRTWGRIAKAKDEIDRWHGPGGKAGPRPLAEGRWQSALAEVRGSEKLRESNQGWYRDKLATLESGQDLNRKPVAEPVKRLSYVKGEMQLEKGLPKLETVMDRGGQQALKARMALLQEQNDLNGQIAKEQEEIRKLAERAAALTDEMRDLFVRIERAAEARQGSVVEQRHLEQLLYNVQVEAELLLDRQAELETRLNELKAARATSQRP
jgi:hypothetical protein